MDGKAITMSAQERKLTIDALLTYGLSLAGLIQSERFAAASPQRAQLLTVLLRTTALLKRLGGQVPAEMELTETQGAEPAATDTRIAELPTAGRRPIH